MQKKYNGLQMRRDRKHRVKRLRVGRITFLAVGLLMVSIISCTWKLSRNLAGNEQSSGTTYKIQATKVNSAAVSQNKGDRAGDMIAVNEDTEKSNKKKSKKETVFPHNYDFSKPVPESDAIGNEYFDDAVFIGDSRTEGMLLYTGLSNAVSYTHKGLMVDTVFTMPVINMDGEKISVMDALSRTDFNKVYIMLGINETGWPDQKVFIEKYRNMIDEIKAINSKATIYVQEILPVTDSVSKTHSYVKNEKINEYNELIRKMAEEKKIYYIDVGNAVSDSNGCLPEDAATDGIHLQKSYCEKWLEYLKRHIITE